MKHLLTIAATAAIAGAVALMAGCGAVDKVKERVAGPASTPTMTSTPTSTPTITPTATPTATPTPQLPPNPEGLYRWNTLPVHFCISAGDDGYVTHDQFVEGVQQAFDDWGIAWRNDGECGPVKPDDGVNEIGWGSLDSEPSGRVYEAGLTQTVTQECTANCDPDDKIRLSEADITIDTAPPREFRSQRCFYSTMLHEAGHFLGIGHLPAPAVMTAQTSGCPSELTAADRAALRERYGARAP
jgi:hypothetical protein